MPEVFTYLMQGDCLERMKEIPDNYVDMVLCDLPYGTTACKWDTIIPFEPLWGQYKRICKGAVVLTATQPFSSFLVCSNISKFKHEWIWDKVRPVGHLTAKKCRMTRHELILVFENSVYAFNPQMELREKPIKGKEQKRSEIMGGESSGYTAEYTHKYPQSILIFSKDETTTKKFHPTQKPIALMEYMIRTYTNEGMIVLDNCMGSGTTGVACVNTGRNFIGIEQDEKYFSIAQQRIEEAKIK